VCGPIRSLRWREPVSERTWIIYYRTRIGNLFATLCQIYNKSYLTLRSGANLPYSSIAEGWDAARLVGNSSALVLPVVLIPTLCLFLSRGWFLGAFLKLRIATIRFVMFVRLSVFPSIRPTAWNNLALTIRTVLKCGIWVFFSKIFWEIASFITIW